MCEIHRKVRYGSKADLVVINAHVPLVPIGDLDAHLLHALSPIQPMGSKIAAALQTGSRQAQHSAHG